MDTRVLGRWGEAQAAAYLRRKGYELLAAGYRCRYGEIDLIAKKRTVLAFVEVKLRRSESFARPREYVDGGKQQRIRLTAQHWLQSRPTELQPRFDVIEIYAPEGTQGPPREVVHLKNAF